MAKTLDQGAVNSFLRGPQYPMSRDDLVRLAERNKVPDELLLALKELPAKQYASREEVVDQIRGHGHNIDRALSG